MTDAELQAINDRHATLQVAASTMAEAVPRHSADTVAQALLVWVEVALEHIALPEDIDGELAANLAALLAALRARAGSTGAMLVNRSGGEAQGARGLPPSAARSAGCRGSRSLCGAVCRRLRRDAGCIAGRSLVHRHRPRAGSSVLRDPVPTSAADASARTSVKPADGPVAAGPFQMRLAGAGTGAGGA